MIKKTFEKFFKKNNESFHKYDFFSFSIAIFNNYFILKSYVNILLLLL